MAEFAGGKIQGFVGPTELGGADDLEAVIIDFIAQAEKSLDIAVQELDSLPIAQAILDAAWRKVSIRMVLEQDYIQDEELPKVKPKAGETADESRIRTQWREERPLDMNRDILAALLRSGIHVSADYNPKIFHQKFIIRDFRTSAQPTSALLTGSANFTHTDCHTNLNHLVVFHDARVCGEYRAEFEQIASGEFGRGRHGEVPSAFNLHGVPVKILFAPDHTPELEIMKQLLKVKPEGRVDFAIFTFAGSSGIDDALILLKRAKCSVRGVLDPGQAAQKWAATKWLHEAGVELFIPKREAPFRKLHHKLVVIDDAIVVAGSFNYTAPANEYNDENIFVLGSPYADLPKKDGGPVDVAECAKITGFFRAEIDRIVARSDPYRPPEED